MPDIIKATNILEEAHTVSRAKRSSALRDQRSAIVGDNNDVLGNRSSFTGCTVWFTGLSGAGKTTISFALEDYLVTNGIPAYSLDGDNVRHGLNSNLGFSEDDREENIRRIGEVAKLFADGGIICLTSFISPFRRDRDRARAMSEAVGLRFFEVFVDTSLEECEARDVKGLYKKARAGLIKGFTGIDQPYEDPYNPDLVIYTQKYTVQECVSQVVDLLNEHQIVPVAVTNQVHNLMVPKKFHHTAHQEAAVLPSLEITKVDLQWLQVLSEGWATPLKGFMTEEEYLQSIHFGCLLKEGVSNQSLPIVLPLETSDKDRLVNSYAITLCYGSTPVAIVRSPEFYEHRKEERCNRVFGTNSKDHEFVQLIHSTGDWLCGGNLEVIERIRWKDGLDSLRYTPLELRQKFRVLEADAVMAIQLKGPFHKGHGLLINESLKILKQRGYKNPALLLHAVGGWTNGNHPPLDARIPQYEAALSSGIIDSTLTDRTVLSIFPSPILQGGPSDTQWHCAATKRAGVNFYIVGRDPSGIPKSSQITNGLSHKDQTSDLVSMAPGLKNIEVIPCRLVAYHKQNETMQFYHPEERKNFQLITKKDLQKYAKDGKAPPQGFMTTSMWEPIKNHYKSITC